MPDLTLQNSSTYGHLPFNMPSTYRLSLRVCASSLARLLQPFRKGEVESPNRSSLRLTLPPDCNQFIAHYGGNELTLQRIMVGTSHTQAFSTHSYHDISAARIMMKMPLFYAIFNTFF